MSFDTLVSHSLYLDKEQGLDQSWELLTMIEEFWSIEDQRRIAFMCLRDDRVSVQAKADLRRQFDLELFN